MERDRTGRDRSWVDDAAELLRLLARTDVEELEVEHDGTRMVIRRDPGTWPASLDAASSEPVIEAVPATFVVTSPQVGVFRRSAGGKAEAPVQEGEEVTAGQVVGAIEAMRMMNRIQTERSGVVESVLVQDGEPVEYGQALIVLRPS